MNNMKSLFLLRDDITFLNFGSFGACPKPVFEEYQRFQRELEEEPVAFMIDKSPKYLKESRWALGRYLNCEGDDVVCVTNPSYAVNIIARSLDLKPGDEVLTTNLEYGACDRAWKYYCRKRGAIYKQQEIRFPIESKEDIVRQLMAGVTAQTKIIFISHITSSTGLRLPVEEICKEAQERGIMTFVDGAHGPGQVEVDLTKMGVDIYTGACHKWMLTPKGSSFLYVRRELQHLFDPIIISWGYESDFPSGSQFLDYNEVQGTRDLSAFCTIPAAIRFMEELNWPAVAAKCRAMVQNNAEALNEVTGYPAIAPINDDFIAQMYSSRINTDNPMELHDKLYRDFKIQIPVMMQGNQAYIRYSVNAFNSQEDLDKLVEALRG
ncbi:MAG: aminotransferase class V-fold PLP-dependent enzyme [Saprospiraceae bacterium]|nr:aminotransferase class V-fold PLP-dependent enzyme [Saprospiraceae bacterium]